MLVSILSVAYNSEKTIARTIESVLNQTYDNIEYIIVDGLSSDKTVEIAQSYVEQFKQHTGRSYKIISEKDNGMYDALNKGARLATGFLVGQINTDDYYELDAVEKMVNFYNTNPYDIAWGSLRVLKPTGAMIKHAKIGKLWTTTGWCHPGMFSKRTILLEMPYALETMYDDFDFITAAHKANKNIKTIDTIITNFTFGGISTKKSLKEVKRRIDITYGIYRKYGMSRLYWFHRFALEMAKYILS